MTKYKAFLNEMTRIEAGKEQINIAQMTEVMARLSDLAFKSPVRVLALLHENGKRRDHDRRMIRQRKARAKRGKKK